MKLKWILTGLFVVGVGLAAAYLKQNEADQVLRHHLDPTNRPATEEENKKFSEELEKIRQDHSQKKVVVKKSRPRKVVRKPHTQKRTSPAGVAEKVPQEKPLPGAFVPTEHRKTRSSQVAAQPRTQRFQGKVKNKWIKADSVVDLRGNRVETSCDDETCADNPKDGITVVGLVWPRDEQGLDPIDGQLNGGGYLEKTPVIYVD